MTEFQPFLMERMMSKFEKDVDYNLSESGAHPISLGELLGDDPDRVDHLLAVDLDYPHANGTPELRENIALLYDGAGAENVMVTVGAIEANYICLRTLLAPGDEIVIMLPNYMQIFGVAKNHGLNVKTFHLKEDRDWAFDQDELNAAVTADTKLIAVCNPDNPTGHIFTADEMEAVVAAADRAGAWILADEVYTGAERVTDEVTPSFYGRYDKVLAIGSLSKAYGLPGLRLGWVVAPPNMVDQIWARHEYITLSAAMLSNKLAALALSPEVRPRLLGRTRGFIRRGYPVLEEWMGGQGDVFSLTPPQAAAVAFIRYRLDINSTEFTNRLCEEKGVLIVPGDHFGMDRFVRISFGQPHDYLEPALERIHEFIMGLREH